MIEKGKTKKELIKECEDLRYKLERMHEIEEEYERLSQALIESERKYQSLVETNLYGILEIDIYGSILFMNSVHHELLGYEEGELKGKQVWDLLASDTDKEELTQYLTQVAEGDGNAFPWTGKFLRKDGQVIELMIHWNCRADIHGRVMGFISLVNSAINQQPVLQPQSTALDDHLEAISQQLLDLKKKISENLKREHKQANLVESLQRQLKEILESDLRAEGDQKETANLVIKKLEAIQQLLHQHQVDTDSQMIMKLDSIQEQLDTFHDHSLKLFANGKNKDEIISDLQEQISELQRAIKEKDDWIKQILQQQEDSDSHGGLNKLEEIVRDLNQVREDIRDIWDTGKKTDSMITGIYEKLQDMDDSRTNDTGENTTSISQIEELNSMANLKLDGIQEQLVFVHQDIQQIINQVENLFQSQVTGGIGNRDTDGSTEIKELSRKIDRLTEDFSEKLKNDTQKDKLIDSLHQELQEYKNDIQNKFLQSVILDVIQVIDNIRKLTNHYSRQDPSDYNPEKLLELLKNIPSDLEDLFYWQGVKPFTCEGKTFDPTRQRVLKTYETQDKEKDKTVEESIRPGYEWNGKVIRPEMVAVNIWKDAPAEQDIRSSDEQTGQ